MSACEGYATDEATPIKKRPFWKILRHSRLPSNTSRAAGSSAQHAQHTLEGTVAFGRPPPVLPAQTESAALASPVSPNDDFEIRPEPLQLPSESPATPARDEAAAPSVAVTYSRPGRPRRLRSWYWRRAPTRGHMVHAPPVVVREPFDSRAAADPFGPIKQCSATIDQLQRVGSYDEPIESSFDESSAEEVLSIRLSGQMSTPTRATPRSARTPGSFNARIRAWRTMPPRLPSWRGSPSPGSPKLQLAFSLSAEAQQKLNEFTRVASSIRGASPVRDLFFRIGTWDPTVKELDLSSPSGILNAVRALPAIPSAPTRQCSASYWHEPRQRMCRSAARFAQLSRRPAAGVPAVDAHAAAGCAAPALSPPAHRAGGPQRLQPGRRHE